MFPVTIWVPHAYPRESPILYVTPTKDMAVRPGQYVSGEGRVYHPYLASWREDVSFYYAYKMNELDECLQIVPRDLVSWIYSLCYRMCSPESHQS